MSTDRVLHCWQNGPPICVHDPKCTDECFEGMSSTCFLEKNHSNDHEWTRDDKITVSFA